MPDSTSPHPFVSYLETLAEDRAALAALRRGLGQPTGTAAEMYPYVVPRLPVGLSQAEQNVYFTVAALYAYHPASTGEGNLGNHLRQAVHSPEDLPAVERRFVVLLNTHPDDLDDHLRQTVGFLRSKDLPVNWHQLLRDIRAWGHPQRYIQRRWANAFWRAPDDQPAPGAPENE